MPEKKEVRKTKPIARDPTIAEEKKSSHTEKNNPTIHTKRYKDDNLVLIKKNITCFEGGIFITSFLEFLFQLKFFSKDCRRWSTFSHLDKENAEGVYDAEDDAVDKKRANHYKPCLKKYSTVE